MAQATTKETGAVVCMQPNKNILMAAEESCYFVEREAATVPLRASKAPAEKFEKRYKTPRPWIEEAAANKRHRDSAGLGLLTGKVNKITVLDDDDGGDAVAALFASVGLEIPRTTVARTGGGGMHFYFQYEPRLGNWTSIPGIDIRNDGAIVVLPGSLHSKTGRRYEWINPPEDGGFAELPVEAVQAVLQAMNQSKGAASSGGLKDEPDGSANSGYALPERIVKGTRNDTLFRFACSLRARSVPEDRARCLVGQANEERCGAPLGERELDRLLKSAYSYDEGPSDGWEAAGGAVREELIENPWSATDERIILGNCPHPKAVLSVLRDWAKVRHPVAFAHEPLKRALKEQCGLDLDRDQLQYCLQQLDRRGFIRRPDERTMEIKGWNQGYYEIWITRPPSEEHA